VTAPRDVAAQVALNAALARGALPITSACNFACFFCSNRQNPPNVRTYRFPHRPLADIRRDIELLPRSGRIVIGEAATRIDEGEPFLHPDCERILAAVRAARPRAELVVTTNGSLLDRNRAELLAALAPVSVNLSLNMVTPAARRHWLGDRQPERALAAARLLTEHGVPWHGSLVGMPYLTGWEEIDRTLRFLAEAGALTARLFLPGFTRLAPPELKFGRELWSELAAFAGRMARALSLPITVEPPLLSDLAARVAGVISGSPAARAGLRAGDIIAAVGPSGERPRTRVDCYRLLSEAELPCALTVERETPGEAPALHALTLSPRPAGETKDGRAGYAAHGVVLDYDVDPRQVDRAVGLMQRARGATLILTGALAAPLIALALRRAAPDADWRVVTVENRFFGGSIMAAGLLTVGDIIAAGRAAAREGRPALILLPGRPFDERGRDLLGQSYFDVAEALGAPVELIE